jgi:hypothetical protein
MRDKVGAEQLQHIPPAPSDPHVRLVYLPAIANQVPARPGSIGQQRREPQHPPVDGDVVDLNAALSKQLLDVAVRPSEAQVPADRQHDHVGREAEAGEDRSRNNSRARAAGSYAGSFAAQRRSQLMQQCRIKP